MSINYSCDNEKSKLPIGKMKQKEEKIDPKIIAQQITMISKDIISNEIVKYLNDNISQEIYECFEKTYAKKISQVIQTKGDFITILENWKDQNDEKLTPILDKVFLSLLSKEESKSFLLETVIPYIMNADTNIEIRDLMVKAAFLLLKSVDISDLTLKEYDQFLQAVNTKYFTTIGQFRDLGYRNWHKLWIFLVRFFGKKIHASMDLTNKLLRIVEYAFRNSDHMQRIRGYDCWKELIDNASLDMKCICSPKQIKLLITPLKAKFSKQEVVICKRFDVFTYLLEKLQEQSILCLSEYLEFCFGPLGDNKEASKNGQCKSIPVLWEKSTKVLIELLGHSHGNTDCLITNDVINLNRPVITSGNFHIYYKQVIQSVAECSVLLKDSDSGIHCQKVLFCMWHSIFNYVIPASETNKPMYYKFLSGIFENFLKEVTLNQFFDQLMVNILCTLLSFDKDFICEAVQYFLPHILQTLLLTDLPIQEVDKLKTVLNHCFTKITLLEEKLCMMKDIMDCFSSSNKEINLNIGKIWICLAEELVSDLDVEMIEQFVNFEEFFIWPANYLHLLDEQTCKQILLPWVKLYRKISNDQDSKKLILLHKLEALFKSNPLLSFSVVSVLSVMAQFQTKYSKDFILKLLKVTHSILQKPNLTATEEYKACSIVLQYLDSSLECYTSEKNPEIMQIICNCIQSILCLHKDFKLLESFSGFVKTIPEDVKSVFSENLLKVLRDLQSDINKDKSTSNKYLSKELQKALAALEYESQKDDKKIFVAPSGRSARIAQLAKKSPKSPKKQGTSPVALRLFGKDPETMAPLNVKGSQLNNSPNPKKKKGANVVELKPKPPSPLLEENSADFVVINSEVKFEPEKLSEHQKEVLKKRRDDIPALYEDLSQSLSNSQDLFSAKFNTNTNNTQKVIVESIHYFPPIPRSEEKTIKLTEKEELKRCDAVTTYKSEDLFSSSSNIDSGLSKDYVSQLKEDVGPTKEEHITQQTDLKQLLIENICTKEDGEDNKSKSDNSSTRFSTTNKQDSSEDKRKRKIEKELQKLKMDVVGADNYVAVPKRTRRKEKKDKEEQESKPSGRKSMAAIEKSSKGDQNRRKSIGVVDELKSKNEEKTTQPANPNNVQDNDKTDDVSKPERRTVGRPKKTLPDIVSEVDGAVKVEGVSVNNNTVKSTPIPKRAKKDNEEIQDKVKKTKDKNEDKVKKVKRENEDKVEKVEQENEGKVKNVKQDNEVKVKKSEVPSKTVEETSTNPKKLEPGDIHIMDAIVNDITEMLGPSILRPKSPLSKEKTENVTLAVTPKSSRRFSLNAEKNIPTPVPEKPIEEISTDSELEFKNRKGGKRKNKVDMESEDIIESSQESFADVTPLLNSSKRRKLSISLENVPVEENSKIPTTCVTPEVTAEIPKTETVATAPVVVEDTKPQLEIIETQDIEAAINTTQDTTISRETTLDSTQTQDSLQDISLSSKTDKIVPVDRQDTLTQDTLTQITQETPSQIGLDVLSDMDKPTVLYLDLPKKPHLTESEQIMSRMDTMSICSNLEEFRSKSPTRDHHQSMEEIELNARSPTKNQNEDDQLGTPSTNSIPSSPVTFHTPSKTTELLNSTFDISPITSETNSYSSDESSEVPVVKPLIFDSDKCKQLADASEANDFTEVNNENDVDDLTREDEDDSFHDEMSQGISRIDNIVVANKNEEIGSEGDVITSDIHPGTDSSSNNDQNLDDEDDPVVDDVASGEEKTLTNTKTDPDFEETSETLLPRSVQSNFPKEASSIQDRSSKLRQIISRNSPIPNNSKFIKRRCLGAASPSAGRIKRLMHGLQTKPVVEKIEEVCEEDILTFTRDLPSPLAVPRNSILKRKFSDTNDSDSISPLAKRKRVNFSDPCLTSKKVFIKEEYQPSIEAKRLFDPSLDSNTGEENIQNIFYDILDNIAQTESDNIETEPTLEIVNPHLLKKDKPIYPKLVDCKDDVMIILKKVMSPLFMNSLMNKLKSKRIKTIGDLSMMSETEINRLPFKVPVVANVYRTLDNYYKKKYGDDEINGQKPPSMNGVVDEKKDILVVKKEAKAEVVVKKLDFKEQLEDLVKNAIRENVNLEEISKTVFSSLENGARHQVLKGILPKCDPEYVIDNTIETCGTSKILDKLQNSQQEVIQFCSKKVALKDIVKNHTVDDLRLALSDLTETNAIDKNDVIQNCFVPLLSKLSEDGHDQFLSNLSKTCLNGAEESLTVQLCKKDLLSTKDLSSCLKNCLSAKEGEDHTEMMVELFRFSSRNLSTEMLMPLLAELFSSISNKSIKDKLLN